MHRGPARPGQKVLEISSRSGETMGKRLSAMYLPARGYADVPVESVYQGGKDHGRGPSPAIAAMRSGFAAKQREKARAFVQGAGIEAFHVGGHRFDASTGTAAYDYLWARSAVRALGGPAAAAKALSAYDGFSDVFDRPGKSMACQAQAAAVLRIALNEAKRDGPLSAGRDALPDVLRDPER